MCKPTSSFAQYYYKAQTSSSSKGDNKCNPIKRSEEEFRRHQQHQRRWALIEERIQFILFMKILLECMKRSTNDEDHHMMLLNQVRLVVITCTNGHKLHDPTFDSLIDSIKCRLKKIIGETIYWKQAHQYTHYYLCCKKEALMRVKKFQGMDVKKIREEKNNVHDVAKAATTTTATSIAATTTTAKAKAPPPPPPAVEANHVSTLAVARKPSLTSSIFSYESDSSCGSLLDDEPINFFVDGRRQTAAAMTNNDQKCPPVASIQFESTNII